MRGVDERSGELFSYVDLEARVRRDHPLRRIRILANAALGGLEGDFAVLYSSMGRPSIAPEKLLRAMLLQVFYGLRSERQLMERLEYDLLFRWFVGLGVDDPAWDHSTFSKNRDRLLAGEIAARFLMALLAQPKIKRLLSSDHFLGRWNDDRSLGFDEELPPKDDGQGPDGGGGRNAERNFRGEKRSNETHESSTDPEARLYRKGDGQPARLCYLGHVLMENRHGLAVAGCVTQASGTAEREAALALLDKRPARHKRRITLGADKAYDVQQFVRTCAIGGSRRTSPSTAISPRPASDARRPSTSDAFVMPAMRSASAAASGSRRYSGGPRAQPASPRSSCEAGPRSMRSSPSPWPPII